MALSPHIFTAKVMHKRLFPKVNGFTYNIYYLALPLSKLHKPATTQHLAVNRFSFISFWEKDHGNKTEENEPWIRGILSKHQLNEITKDIVLISMPRVMGYAFNPVSFWLCLDKQQKLRAVLYEVNNTFGETHSYLCAHEKGAVIHKDDWLKAQKLFHVSPFLTRDGHYTFRFSLQENKLGIWIDYYNAEGKKQLITSLVGQLQPLTKKTLRHANLTHPFVTIKTILLIHWQAIKLLAKGIKYITKPKQRKERLSQSK